MRKLFSRDLLEKPLYSTIIIISVIFAVVLMYCVMSYSAVIVDIEAGYALAKSGNAELVISSNSLSAGTLVPTSPLNDNDGIESYTGVLEMNVSYTQADGNYGTVFLRGFEPTQIESLQPIEYIGKLFEKTEDIEDDQVIISYSFAQRNNLKLNSRLSVVVNGQTCTLYVVAVAADRGYFFGNNDTAITTNRFVATQYGFSFGHVYNKVYVNAVDGMEEDVLESLSVLPAYKDFDLKYSSNKGSTDSITRSYIIGFSICSVALVIAAMLIVYKVFDAQFKTKSLVISRLKIIGAKSGRIALLFFAETAVFCAIGALIGCGVAVLSNKLIVEVTTGMTPVVNGANLAISAITVLFMALLTAMRPIVLSARQSIKQCMTESKGSEYRVNVKLIVFLTLILIIFIILEFTVNNLDVRSYSALVALIVTFILAIVIAPLIFKLTGKLMSKIGGQLTTLSANVFKHNRNSISSLQIMIIGVLFCLMSTAMMNAFTKYLDVLVVNSVNVVSVYNVADMGNERLSEFSDVEGVQFVTPAYQAAVGSIKVGDFNDVSLHAISKFDRIRDLIGFNGEADEIRHLDEVINDERVDYILITDGCAKLNDLKIGGKMEVSYKGKTHNYTIGGIITTSGSTAQFFVDRERFVKYFDTADYNIVFMKVDNVAAVTDRLRTEFIDDKVDVIPLQAVITQILQRNLMSARFIDVVTTFIAIIVAAAVVCNIILGELHSGRENEQLLLIGSTNKTLMKRTCLVNLVTGLIFAVVILVFGAIGTAALSDAAVIADAFMLNEFFAKDIFTYISIFFALHFIAIPIFRLIQPYKIRLDNLKTL